jgi:malonate transporter and related proteins
LERYAHHRSSSPIRRQVTARRPARRIAVVAGGSFASAKRFAAEGASRTTLCWILSRRSEGHAQRDALGCAVVSRGRLRNIAPRTVRKQIVAVMAAIATLRGRSHAKLSPRKGTGVTTIILDCLAPVFFGMALGYLAGWTRDVDNTHVAEFNALVMDFAVPASMFVTVVQASRRTLLDELPLAANLSISMLILYLMTYFMARRAFGAGPGEASIQALTTSLPNYASAGLPLISALLGADHLVPAAVAIACGSIVVSPITLVILDRTSLTQEKRSITASLVSAVKKPIVLSPILAVAFVLTGIGLPDALIRSLVLMGQVAGGAGLFLTGLILSAQKLSLDANTGIQTLLANVAHPLLAATLAWLFAVSPLTAREAIVLSALPVGFFGVLFGLRFNKSSEVAGTTLIASTVLSAATLAAAIYLTVDLGQQ